MTTVQSVSTSDLGLMIRDFIEGRLIVDCNRGPVRIDFVDVSDASNPVVYLENGQKLTVRIFIR